MNRYRTTTARAFVTCAAAGLLLGGTASAANDVDEGPGVDGDSIAIGAFNDLSGPIAALGTPAIVGTEMYFELVNEAGGICGRQVDVIRGDTKYDIQTAFQVYRANVDDIAFLTQLLGTATVLALAPDVERDGVTTLAGTASGDVLPLPSIYGYLTPFTIEALVGMEWAAGEFGTDGAPLSAGVIHQSDPYGAEGLDALTDLAAAGVVSLDAAASYSTGDTDFTAQAQAMIDAGVEVVWLQVTPAQIGGIVGTARQLGYDGVFIGSSASYVAPVGLALGELLADVYVVSSTLSIDEDHPELDRLRGALAEHAPDATLDNFMVVGWISAQVTHAALERACADGALTREGIAAAMDGLTVDTRGLSDEITYGAELADRVPARTIRVTSPDPTTGALVAVTDFLTTDLAQAWAPGS